MENINILGIIPARGGSKRIPNKNKTKIAGRELVRYVIEAAIHSRYLSSIIVSSDDEDILAIADEYPLVRSLERPAEISTDTSSAISYVDHALASVSEPFQYVAILQPTSPFTLTHDIDSTIDLFFEIGTCDSAVSVMKLDHFVHPKKLKKLQDGLLISYMEDEQGRMAEHELSPIYVRNGSVYFTSLRTIKQGRIIGDACAGYVMPRERSLDINDPIDLDFAEYLIKKNRN